MAGSKSGVGGGVFHCGGLSNSAFCPGWLWKLKEALAW